jgi:two-component system sensor histidine kinase QseC
VTVEDSGAGLSSADMARLGERFFRVLGTEAMGSGLGWSIVRHIASLQRVDVQVGKSADLGGLRVTLRFSRTNS